MTAKYIFFTFKRQDKKTLKAVYYKTLYYFVYNKTLHYFQSKLFNSNVLWSELMFQIIYIYMNRFNV